MLRLVPVVENSLDNAKAQFHRIHPKDRLVKAWKGPSGELEYDCYDASVHGAANVRYWFVYDDDTLVGHMGLYKVYGCDDSSWLGWFGVEPELRRKGYGRQIIGLYEGMAREQGFKYARLYTSMYDNEVAHRFYRACGYWLEDYDNERCSEGEHLMIGTKVLADGAELVPWLNADMDL